MVNIIAFIPHHPKILGVLNHFLQCKKFEIKKFEKLKLLEPKAKDDI